MASRTVAVVGGTGAQGSGVVAHLLRDPHYVVRAVSSNTQGAAAQKLLLKHKSDVEQGRLTVVTGDLDNQASLEAALAGADAAFAAMRDGPDEFEQGQNLIRALKTTGVQHFVYSTLFSIKRVSNGKYTKCTGFDNKEALAQLAFKELPLVTAISGSWFYTFNHSSPFCARRTEDGTIKFCLPLDPHLKMQWCDEYHDYGAVTAAILKADTELVRGKTYLLLSPFQSQSEMAATYERITGEKAVADPVPWDTAFAGVPEAVRGKYIEMFSFLQEQPAGTINMGASKPEDNVLEEELGVRASTFEEFLQRTGFRIP
ncbi:uncharacterized protein JCM10292_001924 [Rhodotorula paludigena]|uniref:uncharacterized protein n=1 Tax=Rhodotorula paludigena TaxID=86838 RepID=UPI003175CC80